jgi:hypothetical protein
MAKTGTRHNTTEALVNNGRWLAAVGGWWSLGAVLNKNKEFLRTALVGLHRDAVKRHRDAVKRHRECAVLRQAGDSSEHERWT